MTTNRNGPKVMCRTVFCTDDKDSWRFRHYKDGQGQLVQRMRQAGGLYHTTAIGKLRPTVLLRNLTGYHHISPHSDIAVN